MDTIAPIIFLHREPEICRLAMELAAMFQLNLITVQNFDELSVINLAGTELVIADDILPKSKESSEAIFGHQLVPHLISRLSPEAKILGINERGVSTYPDFLPDGNFFPFSRFGLHGLLEQISLNKQGFLESLVPNTGLARSEATETSFALR